MRVCIIEMTGSRRPHKADSVSPLFLLSKTKHNKLNTNNLIQKIMTAIIKQTRVMESVTIQKNEISPRNLINKVSFCFILLFFTALICNAQNNQKTDWEKDGLRGKVKNVITRNYNAIFRFGEIIKGEEDECANVTDGTYEAYYNDAGKITDSKWYEVPGYGGYTECYRAGFKYIYDEKDNLIEVRKYYIESGDPWERTIHKYNNDGSIAETIHKDYFYNYQTTTTYIYKYNEKGDIIEENQVSTSNMSEATTNSRRKYDNKGNLIEYVVWYENSKYYPLINEHNPVIKDVFEYDDTGKRIREDVKYNDKGDIIEGLRHWYGDYYKNKYEYKYDEKGNWIERITYEKDTRTPIILTERIIEYYE